MTIHRLIRWKWNNYGKIEKERKKYRFAVRCNTEKHSKEFKRRSTKKRLLENKEKKKSEGNELGKSIPFNNEANALGGK